MASYVYDANQVSLVFFGIPIDSGYADGEFLTLVMHEDDFKLVVGTDGSAVACATNDRTAKIEVKLLQSSQGNDALSAIRAAGVAAQNGTIYGPMLIKDRLGTSLYTAAHCFIQKPPDVAYDRTAKDRVWILACTDLLRVDGGNTPA